ncbi:MAG: HAMP domain-containing histidine kinase [Anaerolineae bacterium]|nr:HAMP domain-containing histidine kinase [Anaerolineae bacterium]
MAKLHLDHPTAPPQWAPSTIPLERLTISDGLRLLHHLTAPAVLINGEHKVIDANHAAEDLLDLKDISLIDEVVQQAEGEKLSKGAKALLFVDSMAELTVGAPDEDARYFELSIAYIDQRDGSRVVLFQDISQRKQADQARDMLIDSLESYASTVAHDFKAPLGTLLGFAALLEMDSPHLTDEQRYYIRIIQMTSNKMSKMIDDILLAATVHSLDQVPRETIDILAIIRQVVERLNGMIKEFDADIEIVTELPLAFGYAPWVEEILANYISNGIKYGGAPPSVQIGADVEGDQIRYWVRDNGVGLSPENRAVLFKQTARFDTHRRGHGLGLTIVRRIVERLGGQVGVESELGHGSLFYFTLPRAQVALPKGR